MSFFKFLKGIGDRLGIVETVAGFESAPVPRIQTRTVSLRELSGEIKSNAVRALADSPAELAIPVERIFEAAGISSKPEDWNVDRLKQVLEKEAAKQDSRESVQRTVLELLNSAGVKPEAIVVDAIARDQALDSFESRVSERMQERMQACKSRLQEIELQIKDLHEERARFECSLKFDEEKWREWRKLKRAHERELASVVSYIVDRPVVTESEEDG